jgi:hypothetical protein
MSPESIARVVHEANSAYCLEAGHDALPHWDDLADEYKRSSIAGVQAALDGASPRALHTSWANERRAAGWVYGPVLNRAFKVHNCLVDYDQLPADQRAKDELFSAIVRALK